MRRTAALAALLLLSLGVAAAATAPKPPAPVFVLAGGGWGHGVGMSQWGAYGQATAVQTLSASGGVSAAIEGLTPGSTIHYRLDVSANGAWKS